MSGATIRENRIASTRRSRVPPENTVDSKGRRICGSQKASGRGICRSTALLPNGRCRVHGGTTPTGVLSPNFRDGRYVRDMPTALQDRFEAAMTDTELLSLRKDASLIDAMITAKLSELREAEKNPDLERITTLVEEVAANYRLWDWTRMDRQLTMLREAITNRAASERTYREVRELVKEKADLVTRENRRMADLNQHLSVEEGMALIRMLIGSIRRACQEEGESGTRILKTVTADYRNAISVRDT
jgi:hypothetical protein